MPSKLVWGLQYLKQKLRSPQKVAFAELEYELLDLLHRQRLHPRDTHLKDEIDSVVQKCDAFARSHTRFGLEDLSTGIPATRIRSGIVPLNTTLSALEPVHQEINLPEVQIDLLTNQVPISYCFQKNANAEAYPLVTLIINTTQLQNTYAANIDIYIDKYGSSSPHHVILELGKIHHKQFLPSITKEQIKLIDDKCPATIRIDIHYVSPKDIMYRDSRQVYLLSYNTAILWRYKWDRSLEDYTQYLAGWVTPHPPQIQKLLRAALEYHPEKEFHGYNYLGSRDFQKQEVRKLVRAVFDVLHKEVNVRYVTSSVLIPSASDADTQIIQRIRLPEDILAAGGPANCIDGSVLFASLLEHASLQPILLLLPHHALVGWRVTKDDPECEFLETTLIGNGDFDQAFQIGQEQYADACMKGFIENPCFETDEYALFIDIEKCRRQDIVSMS